MSGAIDWEARAKAAEARVADLEKESRRIRARLFLLGDDCDTAGVAPLTADDLSARAAGVTMPGLEGAASTIRYRVEQRDSGWRAELIAPRVGGNGATREGALGYLRDRLLATVRAMEEDGARRPEPGMGARRDAEVGLAVAVRLPTYGRPLPDGSFLVGILPPWLEVHPLADGSTLVKVANRWIRVGHTARGTPWSEEHPEESARALLADNSAETAKGGA